MDSEKAQRGFPENIDLAIDSILVPKRRVTLDPATGEVIEENNKVDTSADEKQRMAEVSEKLPPEDSSSEEKLETADQLLSDLNQALLGLEWELSEFNLQIASALLHDLREKVSNRQDCLEIIELMYQVIEAMEKFPQKVPVSASKAMYEGLEYLKVAFSPDDESGENYGPKSAKEVTAELQELIDQVHAKPASNEKDESLEVVNHEQPVADDQQEDRGVNEHKAENSLSLHMTILAQWINQILTLETFFARETSMKKVHALLQMIRRQLEEEKDFLSSAYSAHAGISESPSAVSKDKILHEICDHIHVLAECIRIIKPVENLFANHTGSKKLFSAIKKIRSDFEKSKLELGLHIPRTMCLQTPTRGTELTASARAVLAKCPWDSLNLGLCRGEKVAFIPSQTVFTGRLSWWSRLGLTRLTSFPVKKLKTVPWRGVRSQLQGDLAGKNEADLKKLTLPFLKNPLSAEAPYPVSGKGNIAVVLFNNSKGGVLFLDRMPETFNSADYKWKALPRKKGHTAGYLVDDKGGKIPVLSMR